MVAYNGDRFGGVHSGGRPSRYVGISKKNEPPENPINRVRANEYNPDGYEWIYKDVRVKLHNSSGYHATASNPKRGSKYETMGTITEVEYTDNDDPEHRPVHVMWDNGESNTYYFKDMCRTKGTPKKAKEIKRGKLFNTDDVVLLKPGFFLPEVSNPSVGCDYQCSGLIVEAHHRATEVGVRVRWNNGMRNNYSIKYKAEKDPALSSLVNIDDKDVLKAMVEENPNLAYKLTKLDQKDDYGIISILRGAAGIEDPNPSPVDSFLDFKDFKSDGGQQYYVHIDPEDAEEMPDEAEEVVAVIRHREYPDDEDPEGN